MADIWDLPYLFSKDDSRNVYRQDTVKNRKTIEKINIYNKGFSESLFTSWINNMLLRYILLCSDKNNPERLIKFEKMHLLDNVKPTWHETLELSKYFSDVTAKFVDFMSFIHSKEREYLSLRICIICSKNKNARISGDVEEQEIHYYDMELEKKNALNGEIERVSNYTSNCPNCGAPTEIVTIGICGHCNELISVYDNSWKIRKIKLYS